MFTAQTRTHIYKYACIYKYILYIIIHCADGTMSFVCVYSCVCGGGGVFSIVKNSV